MPLNSKFAAGILYVISGDLVLKRGQIVQLYAGWTGCKCTFFSLPEVASDVISGIVVDVSVILSVLV